VEVCGQSEDHGLLATFSQVDKPYSKHIIRSPKTTPIDGGTTLNLSSKKCMHTKHQQLCSSCRNNHLQALQKMIHLEVRPNVRAQLFKDLKQKSFPAFFSGCTVLIRALLE
jgi:hypothetical protein